MPQTTPCFGSTFFVSLAYVLPWYEWGEKVGAGAPRQDAALQGGNGEVPGGSIIAGGARRAPDRPQALLE
jgi:hypothetical protein